METNDKYKIDMRALRQRVKLRMIDVADALGVSKESISAWELGKLDLKLRVGQLAILLKLYDITFDELVKAWENTEKRVGETKEVGKMMVA